MLVASVQVFVGMFTKVPPCKGVICFRVGIFWRVSWVPFYFSALLSCLMSCHFACWVCICALNWPWWHWHAILTVRSNFEMQPPVWGASGHCLREVNIEEEEEGEGSQKLFDAFDCFLNFSFCLNPCLVFKLTSRRAEKDQWPQHLGLRPALKAFRSSPRTTWAPGDKTADCLC